MNKTDREYLQSRVNGIVKCTNGNIATILNREMKKTGLTDNAKFKMICNGKATIKEESSLVKVDVSYKQNGFDVVLKCFDYPLTETQKTKMAFNKTVQASIDELMQEVTLEGKRLIDQAVLNLIQPEDIPDALHKLGEMANLARKTKLKIAV